MNEVMINISQGSVITETVLGGLNPAVANFI